MANVLDRNGQGKFEVSGSGLSSLDSYDEAQRAGTVFAGGVSHQYSVQ